MKKNVILLLLLVSTINTLACICPNPKVSLEYLSSEKVFLGKVISKKYAKDSLSFKIIFDVIEHFKNDDTKFLEFTFNNSKEITSCDWQINKGDRWLVFAKKRNNKLTFRYYCSNSRKLFKNSYPSGLKKMVDNWHQFNIDNYIFTSLEGSFEQSTPNINLDSLINTYAKNNYGENYGDNIAHIIVDIDKNGNPLQTVIHNIHQNKILDLDKRFNLYKYHPLEQNKPKTKFQKDMFNEIKKVKKWTPIFIKNSNISVPYRKYIQFEKQKDTIYKHYKY